MPSPLRASLLALLLTATSPALAAPQCADDAIAQAHKLLTFHFGEGDRISIDDEAKEMPPLRNPANKRQQLDVLEVWGFIYKAQYRMRFIYFRTPDTCALIGQEILEYATL